MPNIAESFGQGYGVGRQLGDDFSQMRYSHGERKLRQQYADEAKAAGMSVDEYLAQTPDGAKDARIAQLEAQLHDLYQRTGGAKRGVVGRDGQALDMGAIGRMREDYNTGTNRSAGALAQQGKLADAQRLQSTHAYAGGDYQHGVEYGKSAGAIDIANSARNPDGTVDQGKLASAHEQLGGQALQYGDTGGAEQNMAQAKQIRYDLIAHQAGVAYQMAENPSMYDPEQIAAQFTAVMHNVPELGSGLAVTWDKANNQFALVRGEEHVRNFDLQKDALPLLASLQKDPGAVVGEKVEQLRAATLATQKHEMDQQDKIFEAKIELAKSLKDIPKADGFVNALSSLHETATQAGYTVSGDPNNGMIMLSSKAGGSPLVVRFGQQGVDPHTGVATSGISVTDLDGNPVSADQLQGNTVVGAARAAAMQYMGLMQQNLTADQMQRIRGGFVLLDAIGKQAGLPGYENAGQMDSGAGGTRKFPIPETDNYVRTILGNAGPVSGTNREKAKQLMGALVQQESGGNNGAISVKGARGLTQVMPKTAGDPGFGVAPLKDNSPQEYMRFGEDYLTAMLDRYNGDPELALAAYNAGPGTVDGWLQNGGINAQQGAQVAEQGGQPAPAAAQPAAPARSQFAGAPKQAVDWAGIGHQFQTNARELARQLDDVTSRLARFDAEQQPTPTGATNHAIAMGIHPERALSPSQQRFRDQLVAQRDQLNDSLRALARNARNFSDRARTFAEDSTLARRYGTSDHDAAQLASTLEQFGGAGGQN